jgi:inosine/xanthosine triphosphatase
MKIAVGSMNPVKVEAARRASCMFWPDAEVIAVDVPSGISAMPRSDSESMEGALNRARGALAISGCDIAIGLEGHVKETGFGMLLAGVAVAVDREGRTGIGDNGGFLLPEKVAREVREGKELGPVMDMFTNVENSKQKSGASGYFTNGIVPRQ